ncbi:hypothetical protein N0V85_002322 [Neurospora sp. IMI 360204]|nr:hypothetical protein N0V85_002322 [Neurospora sp. IMI 360204]
MSIITIRSLVQLAVVGISTAAAIAPPAITATPYGLITRKVQLHDGTTITIGENPNLVFTPESPNGSKDTKHKRVDWQELDISSPIQDFCWDESRPQFSYGSSAPLAADCQKIVDYYSGVRNFGVRGKWTLYPYDLENGKVVPLVKVDGCQFQLTLSGEIGQKVYWGDNDLVYYVNNQLKYAKDGRVQAEDFTACYVMDEKKYVQLKWRLVKA